MGLFCLKNAFFGRRKSKMKRLQIILLLIPFHSTLFGLNITIIESQYIHTGSVCDSNWREVVASMGHTALIVPYQTLDDSLFFEYTDVLIVSEGPVGISQAAVVNIIAFIKSGKPVYLQSEYLPNYTTNIAFRNIVSALGGKFEWRNVIPGDIHPVNILGVYATTPNQAQSLGYFWYSVSGKGDCNMINFLEFGGEYLGFQFIPDNPSYGSISTTSDENWVNERTSLELMENILFHLITPPPLPAEQQVSLGMDTSFCKGETLLLQPIPIDAVYKWQDGSVRPDFLVQEEGTYWVTTELACGDVIDSVFVVSEYCDCPFFTPNVFSPNSDNINDEFSALPSCELLDFSMLIYNRWGELVFHATDQYESWDGTVNGKDAQSGVYAYMIQYKVGDGEMKHTYGDVTLLR